jgi:hypothetical protein
VNRLEVCLPVVAKTKGRLQVWPYLKLVLNEGANLVHPEDRAARASLLRKGIRSIGLIVREA